MAMEFRPKFDQISMHKSVALGHERAYIAGRRSYEKRSSNIGSTTSGDKHNRCVIVPSKVYMIAEAIERKDTNWFVRTNVSSDLVIHIGKKSTFHLHILPVVSRSAFLNRLIFKKKNNQLISKNIINIELNGLPGGPEIFELIVKFCYGWKIDLTPTNVAPLYCAANFVEMVDDLEDGNLISRTESFLSYVIFSAWKDTFQVLKTCETISSHARDLQIQRKCSEAIAWKVSTNPEAISLGHDESQCFNFWVENDIDNSFKNSKVADNWWFEDVSTLRIDHFIEVVATIKRRGLKAEVLGSCIAYWTAKWLSRISFGTRIPTQKGVNQVRKVIVESLVKVLPIEENSVSCNFLLHLLKVGLMMKIDLSLCTKLEKRVALMLEKCEPLDLVVKNYGESDTACDVGIIARIVETYASLATRNPALKVFVVGRVLDGYLGLVARDENLQADEFRMLVESLPKNARYSNDNLYRAIDRYLKAHPSLTEEERKGVCRALEYHKLSQEAREHAMKNDRLSMNLTTQLMLLEQVSIMQSMVDKESIYRRTKAQTIINLKAVSSRECVKVQNQMSLMRQEVENMKMELDELQICRGEIKRLARRL